MIKSQTITTTSDPRFDALDLLPIFCNLFNSEAKAVIHQHRTNSTVHQWNRQTGSNKYSGSEAYGLGNFLFKFKIKSFSDLFVSNYVRECSLVYYFGWTVEEGKLTEAVLDLVNMFNELAIDDKIRAVLTPLTSIKLANGKYIVLSYFAVDQANVPFVQSKCGGRQFNEGGLPQEYK